MLLWLEERLGLGEILNKPWIPRSAAFWRYFPGVLLVMLVIWQTVSGFLLASEYPNGLQVNNTSQSLAINAHRWGAEILAIVTFCYVLTKLYTASYQRRHELTWLTSLTLALLLVFSLHTGGMLPGSLQGQAGLRLMYDVGSLLSPGAPNTGDNQLVAFSRLYVWHIAALPLLLTLVWSAHLALCVRQVQRLTR